MIFSEEGISDEVDAAAWKQIIVFQIEQEMKSGNMTKTELAKRIVTSRASHTGKNQNETAVFIDIIDNSGK